MEFHDLKPAEGSTKRRKIIARGIGSGTGKTATRGNKGQKAKRNIMPWFEGGQTPIHRRLPVKRGFRNINHKEYSIVNLDDLEKFFKANEEVTPEKLMAAGIISGNKDGIKVLAFGELKKKLTVNAHKFSKTAVAAIEKAGGKTVVIEATTSKKSDDKKEEPKKTTKKTKSKD